MSEDVPRGALAEVVAGYRFAYLMTVTDDGRPHAVAVTPRLVGDTVTVDDVGTRSRANLTQRPRVSLLWPPPDADGYSLIVDGAASVDVDGVVRLAPTRAVRHRPHDRPGGGTSATGCGSDCLPIDLPDASSTA